MMLYTYMQNIYKDTNGKNFLGVIPRDLQINDQYIDDMGKKMEVTNISVDTDSGVKIVISKEVI